MEEIFHRHEEAARSHPEVIPADWFGSESDWRMFVAATRYGDTGGEMHHRYGYDHPVDCEICADLNSTRQDN